jgi:hypothetical protein
MAKSKKKGKPKSNRGNVLKNLKLIKSNEKIINELKNN